MTQDTEICIIGAGLCGLALAVSLKAAHRDVLVLDARDRPGGRVLSEQGHDLGPSWIWPQNQRMLALLGRLGLHRFPQHTDGRMVFEDAEGAIRRDLDMAIMGGALRVAGGLARVTDALAAKLGDSLRLAHKVQAVSEGPTGVTIATDDQTIRAARAVLALPPRLVAGFGLAVPDIPTWMAGQAKLVATYATPFWREDGLNGDAISHRGPLAEIHDASPDHARTGALFGFAQPGAARQHGFTQAAIAQLGRMFGPDATTPVDVYVKDWSMDAATAIPADQTPPAFHPVYGKLPATKRLIFAGTETARTDGGFLEGALTAAEDAFATLMADTPGRHAQQ